MKQAPSKNSVSAKCKKCGVDFILDSDDLGFYEKMKVPPPKVCPDCRFKMRAMFRNETTLYSGRKCDLCGKAVISIYNPKSLYTIYCEKCFFSEKWEPKDYAMDYDENRSFLGQYKKLLLKVPKITTYISIAPGPNINSEYINMAGGCKNCYLVFNTGPAEEVFYSKGLINCKDSCDMYFGIKVERCYESINIQNSSGVIFGENVNGSVDCGFIINCRNLLNCFGCVNLNNKSHYFLNKPMGVDEYNRKVIEILGSYKKMQEFKKEFEEFVLRFPMRENNNIKTVNSTGNNLFSCKNVKESFEVNTGENCHYLYASKFVRDSIGTIGHGINSEHLLEVVASGYGNDIIGSYGVDNSSYVMYGFYLRNCKNCVGCDAIKNSQYFILNKQYSKEEYERLRGKIIEELEKKDLHGLIMPPELAPFAYNETIAQEFFPLTKDEALSQGFRWEDDIQKTEGKETISPEDLPDHINDVPDSITNEILRCIDCNRNYKIINQELLFYRKMKIPIPRKCFYCRHQDRIIRRGPYKFWQRNCAKCQKKITTNYAPDRPEVVYCEKCYQQEVY